MKRILTLGLVALGIMVQAQEKILVSTTTNGDKFYIYPSTIRKSSYGITVWQETVYTTPQLLKGTKKYYTSSKSRWLVDCNDMKMGLIALTNYAKNGNVVSSVNWGEYNTYTRLQSMAPGSVAWHIIEETCSRYNRGY